MHFTSIIILTYNQLDFTKACIASIRKYTPKGTCEIIVVDNQSTDGTVDWLKAQPDIKIALNDHNAGFPRGCNQGIELAKGEEIMLLNNDVVVTPNWLDQLLAALNSEASIGAVGPVTNFCSNYQKINVSYQSIAEMESFADGYNKSDPARWEQRLKLVFYCILFKKAVIDKVGLLDEIFSPGNYEDDDYSLRMIQSGYKLMLCRDTFVHHYGSMSFGQDEEAYAGLMRENRRKFKEKWGFDAEYSMLIRHEICELIDEAPDSALSILEVGCACGATLLHIKNKYPQANLHGVELNPAAAAVAGAFAKIAACNIEAADKNFEKETYNYVIFADVLEHLYNPWLVLKEMKKYIKPDGYVLASIPNVMHFSIMRQLLAGRWQYESAGILDRSHLRFFTLQEIIEMFQQSGYGELDISRTGVKQNEDDRTFVKKLVDMMGDPQLEEQYYTYQYIIKVKAESHGEAEGTGE